MLDSERMAMSISVIDILEIVLLIENFPQIYVYVEYLYNVHYINLKYSIPQQQLFTVRLLKSEYSGTTRPIQWLFMTWLLSSNFHHHAWHIIFWFTHLPLDKMAIDLTDEIFKCIFLTKNDRIPIQISLQLIPSSAIDNKPALVKVMVLAPKKRHAITWANDAPVRWRICVALGGDAFDVVVFNKGRFQQLAPS